MNTLIGQLKKLQDNLGDFNDLCVQQEYLLNITSELPVGGQQAQRTFVAIGSLVQTLIHEKQSVKEAFAGTFTDFSAPANQKLFQALFDTKGKEGN